MTPTYRKHDTTGNGLVRRFFCHVSNVGTFELVIRCVSMALFAFIAGKSIVGCYDNDVWFILSTGREIAENGIPYTNPFSVISGMGFVAQQWLSCVIEWLTYSSLGWTGLAMLVFAEIVGLVLAMRFVHRSFDNHHSNATVTCVVGTVAFITMVAYVSVRPQIITMMLMLVTVGIMERYRRNNNKWMLLSLTPVAILQSNLHSSMIIADVAVVLCYAMPSMKTLAGMWDKTNNAIKCWLNGVNDNHSANIVTTRDYAREPVLLIAVLMLMSACINPYGIDALLYLVRSYGAAGYGDYISEMSFLTPMKTSWGSCLVLLVVFASIGIGRNGMRKMDMPLTLATMGTGYIAFQHTRNVWLFAVMAFVAISKWYDDYVNNSKKKFSLGNVPNASVIVSTIVIMAVVLASSIVTVNGTIQYSDSKMTPINALQWLDSNVAEDNRNDIKVCTMFNSGGFVEYHGYKVSMDPRPETWQSTITGLPADMYSDYVDTMKGDETADTVLGRSDFDYYLVDTGSVLDAALSANKDCTLIMSGNGYKLYGYGTNVS